jgi:diguanylate cyclase (GGDEF)-like protein
MINGHQDEAPKFIVKSTLMMTLLSGLTVAPFFFINLYHQNLLIAALAAVFACIQFFSAYQCYHAKYNTVIGFISSIPMMFIGSSLALFELGVTASYWPFLSVFGFYFTLQLRMARATNILYLIMIFPLGYFVLPFEVFVRFYPGLVGISLFLYICVNEIQNQHHTLTEMSITDSLTGLYNRTVLDLTLENAINLSKRENKSMTLLMIDIDNFKRINDTFGHLVGDEVLKCLSSLMKENFRKTDALFRLGGEEFLVLLRDSNRASSVMVAERLRETISNTEIIREQQVTISVGVSELTNHSQWKDWLSDCDQRLFKAKEAGKNKVVSSIQEVAV